MDSQQSIKELLFSFKGRIARQNYWLLTLSASVVYSFASFGIPMIVAGLLGLDWLGLVLLLPMVVALWWVCLALSVKRWHDRDKSGWWVLLGFVPVLGWIWTFVECGFLRGTDGENQYGADPLETQKKIF